MTKSLRYALGRRLNILKCPHMPMGVRVRCVLSPHAVAPHYAGRIVRGTEAGLRADVAGFSFELPLAEPEHEAPSRRSFEQLIAEGFIDPNLFDGPVRLNPGETALDVGANIGTVSAILSREAGPAGRVVAIEPVMIDALRHNVALNRLGNVQVVECAIGDEPGELEIAIAPGSGGISSSFVSREPWQSELRKVPVKPLDAVVDELGLDRVDFVKVDVEGFEEQVIAGARRTVERFRPRWSISSYHRDRTGAMQYPTLIRRLKDLGYRLRSVPFWHIYAW